MTKGKLESLIDTFIYELEEFKKGLDDKFNKNDVKNKIYDIANRLWKLAGLIK